MRGLSMSGDHDPVPCGTGYRIKWVADLDEQVLILPAQGLVFADANLTREELASALADS